MRKSNEYIKSTYILYKLFMVSPLATHLELSYSNGLSYSSSLYNLNLNSLSYLIIKSIIKQITL